MTARIEWMEGESGSLTKVVVTDSRIETRHLSDGFSEPTLFALVLTDEIEQAIKDQWA